MPSAEHSTLMFKNDNLDKFKEFLIPACEKKYTSNIKITLKVTIMS